MLWGYDNNNDNYLEKLINNIHRVTMTDNMTYVLTDDLSMMLTENLMDSLSNMYQSEVGLMN